MGYSEPDSEELVAELVDRQETTAERDQRCFKGPRLGKTNYISDQIMWPG